LLALTAVLLRARRRHSGTAAAANTANNKIWTCQDGVNPNDTSPTNSAARPSQNRNTPGAINSSAIRMMPKINQFQVPRVVTTSLIDAPSRLYSAGDGGEWPAVGTEARRAAACADSALSPKVAFAISPMPASEPRTLTASIGSMMIFWFGESASCPNALMYLSAIKY